ncbi:Olfactory Receptor 7E24 [Manis pentadactyla]|nr:Olfactory Receptor 7E24 [Manis pentadactyla]
MGIVHESSPEKRCLCYAEPQNLTGVVEFLLLGLTEDPELQPLLFGLFLSMYLVTIQGSLLLTLAIVSDPHLHTPMYFFLSILSLADLGFTSTTVPEMIFDIQTHSRIVSYVGCLIQLSFFNLFGGLDTVFLTVMAYDRIVDICHHLHHVIIMNPASTPSESSVSFLMYQPSLSLDDTGFSITTIPKMLVNIQTHSKSISYAGCLTQVSFFFLFGCLDSLLLAVMAYDRFVAICHPLHYPAIMRPHLCGLLVLLSFLISLLDSQTHCLMVSKLGFCTHVKSFISSVTFLSLFASPALIPPPVTQPYFSLGPSPGFSPSQESFSPTIELFPPF